MTRGEETSIVLKQTWNRCTFQTGMGNRCGNRISDGDGPFCYQHMERIMGDNKVGDVVDHPSHYGGKDNPFEAIKVITAWGLDFRLGSVLKYICRAGKKHPRLLEDLKKARFYLDHKIAELEAQGAE